MTSSKDSKSVTMDPMMIDPTKSRRVVRRIPPPPAPIQPEQAALPPVRRVVKKSAKEALVGQVPVPALKKYKNYTKVGQKYDTPLKTDALYRFYTTLHKQKPDSQMAIKWCVEHGVFAPKKATELLLSMELAKAKI